MEKDRRLPNNRLRWLLMAMRAELGDHGVRMILHQADLERYLEHLPAANRELGSSASEFTRLLNSVRSYYGVGARSTLLRIGHLAFQQQVTHQSVLRSLRQLILFPMSITQRKKWILYRLIADLNYPDDRVTLNFDDNQIFQIQDYSFDRTWQTRTTEPICAYAIGRIQAALTWATGEEFQVNESSCRAMGAAYCSFYISS